MDIATSKNLIPPVEQKAAKLSVCQVFCLLLPGTWESKWRCVCRKWFPTARSCFREQPDQRPPPLSCCTLRLGMAVGPRWAPWACGTKAIVRTSGLWERAVSCFQGQVSLQIQHVSVSHSVGVWRRYRVSSLCLGSEEQVVKMMLVRDEHHQALSLLFISLAKTSN